MQLIKFVSTSGCSRPSVEGTAYLFESDKSHGIFFPSITSPELNIIFTNQVNNSILQKLGRMLSHLLMIN